MALEVIARNFYTPSAGPGIGPGFGSYDLLYDKKNGQTVLRQSGLTLSPAILYQDGSYRSDGLRIPELSSNGSSANTQKAIDLDKSIKAKVREAAQKSKGVLPEFAKVQNQNNPPGSNNSFPGTNPGIATAIPGGSILSAAPGAGYAPIQNIKFEVSNEKKVLGGTTKYPADLDINQDILVITQYNYKSPSGEQFLKGNPAEIYQKGLQRNSALKDPIGTVILPIPSGVKDSNNVAWGPDNMNDMTAAVTAKFMQSDVISNALGVFGADAVKNLIPGADKLPSDAVRNISTLIYALGPGALNSPMVRAALDSMMMGAGGFEVSPETILAKGFGIVPNSNMELLFNGPTLRSFQFGYRMSPRSQQEATNVRKIIRFFKQGMAPRKINAGGASGSAAGERSLFLSTPNVFKLEYKANNKLNKGLNKFKICALTGFAVDYAPDGSWASYEDPSSPGQPVSMSMGLSFQEIEPVYANDYQENVLSGLSNDLQAIAADDVGY